MNIRYDMNGLPGSGEQERFFEEVICSPEFPQVCIDPQDV